MVEKIKKLIKDNGYSVSSFEKHLGFGNGIISKWKTQSPSCDKLVLVADNLNCSVDYLLGRTDNQFIDNGDFSEEEIKLISDYRELSEQGKGYITETMIMAKDRFKKEQSVHQSVEQIG